MEHKLSDLEKQYVANEVKEIFNNIGFPLIGEGARRLVESFDQYIQAAEKVIKEGGLAKAGKDTINNFYTKLDILRGTQRTLKLGGWLELFPAIRETLQNNDINPVAKTTVGILITGTLLANSPYIIGVLGTISIGGLLDYFWEDLKYGAMTLKDFISELIKEGFTSAGGKVLDEKKCRINLNDMLQQCLIPTPKEQICKIKDLFGTAEEVRSPLVVDMDGDGVETVTAEGGVYFDHDANGFKENSGWVGQDDGILVRDINGNGIIDNGTELFGNNSVLSSGEKAVNGFEALKDLDDNNDGIFDHNDKAWNEVKIWQDKNFNGLSDEGELLTLEQAGIAGINLDYDNQENVDENGNAHKQTGTFIKTDGTNGTITDVWFDTNPEDTVNDISVEITDDIKALPNVSGTGNVYDLHTAMALDKSGELQRLVEQFQAETDIDARNALLPEIIYHWAGVYDMDPEGRNPSRYYGNLLGDSRKLEAMEEFLGLEYHGTCCSC